MAQKHDHHFAPSGRCGADRPAQATSHLRRRCANHRFAGAIRRLAKGRERLSRWGAVPLLLTTMNCAHVDDAQRKGLDRESDFGSFVCSAHQDCAPLNKTQYCVGGSCFSSESMVTYRPVSGHIEGLVEAWREKHHDTWVVKRDNEEDEETTLPSDWLQNKHNNPMSRPSPSAISITSATLAGLFPVDWLSEMSTTSTHQRTTVCLEPMRVLPARSCFPSKKRCTHR